MGKIFFIILQKQHVIFDKILHPVKQKQQWRSTLFILIFPDFFHLYFDMILIFNKDQLFLCNTVPKRDLISCQLCFSWNRKCSCDCLTQTFCLTEMHSVQRNFTKISFKNMRILRLKFFRCQNSQFVYTLLHNLILSITACPDICSYSASSNIFCMVFFTSVNATGFFPLLITISAIHLVGSTYK